MADTPTHKGEYAGDLWPPGYYDATHYWLDGAWRELPLSMEQNMRLMASEIERLRAALRDCLSWHDYSNDMHKPIEVRAAYMRARAALDYRKMEDGRT